LNNPLLFPSKGSDSDEDPEEPDDEDPEEPGKRLLLTLSLTLMELVFGSIYLPRVFNHSCSKTRIAYITFFLMNWLLFSHFRTLQW